MSTVNSEVMQKIEQFEAAVTDEVSARCKEINAEIEAYRKSELLKYKDDVLNESYNIIHKQTGDISLNSAKEISLKRAEVKRKLYERRDEYMRLIFTDVRMELSDFVKSDDYLPFLLEKTKNISEAYGCDGFVLLVKKDDLPQAEKLQKAFGFSCTVEPSEQITLGGLIAKNKAKGYVIDESLDSILEGQHEWFCSQPSFVVTL
ncbi:MAG: V-type ATP synthase subunit E [Hydrogenoanaerobacterium sp.]